MSGCGYSDCLIYGRVTAALILYGEDGVCIGLNGKWVKATWNSELQMWEVA
ncbi:hypothetical protein KDI_44600 [Dictyobacter arantiisoli]|uniref:Uncharacterized protein n=1 Tax=Dictyobacter arantiisoli TaxID=2014874 RepID=A0A5A5TIF5_9CHLR|nr:hypothetical protein KDI_44600 [Dictyobacter arantiisoli]